MARQGAARRGQAWQAWQAWLGAARIGKARLGLARRGEAELGAAGLAWLGEGRFGQARHGLAWRGAARQARCGQTTLPKPNPLVTLWIAKEVPVTLQVETVPIDSVSPDPANTMNHPPRNISAIEGSLKRFGLRKPIVVDSNGVIRAGNGTWQAAKNLGWQTIDVARTNLAGSEATAYSIADNRTAELAEWNEELLARLLPEMDYELQLATGFDEDDLKELFAEQLNNTDSEIDREPLIDKAGELQRKWKVELGQFWQIDRHLVYCGDALDWSYEADGVCTDPPYDMSCETIRTVVRQYAKVAAVICTGRQAFNLARDGWEYAMDLCWSHKSPRSINTKRTPLFYHANVVVMNLGGNKTDWTRPRPNYGSLLHHEYEDWGGHGQGKSPNLFAEIMEGFPWETMADPFAGTLATLIAAHKQGRTFIGCEKEPKMLAVGLERCSLLCPKVLTDKQLSRYNAGKLAGGQQAIPKHARTVKESENV